MKALTLTQPWASLMQLRRKTIETRSWRTDYRGELVIHAAKGFPKFEREMCEWPEFAAALGSLTAADLPLSRGLCVVKVLGCIPTHQLHGVEMLTGKKPSVEELKFGNYAPGRFAWVTEFVRPLDNLGPVRGALSLWDWPESEP